jgi:hypothetical protein
MKRWLPHIGIVLGVMLAVYALFFGSSDEDLIREQLERLEDAIAVSEGGQNVVVRAAHIRKEFSEIFIKDVSFEVPDLTTEESGRRALVALAASAPQLFRSAHVDLDSLAIGVDGPGLTAVAQGNATLTGTRQSGEPERDQRQVSLRFDKIDGNWLCVSLSVGNRGGS